jgi:hydrogenase maturation protease
LTRVLVLTWGNPSRGDDALGPELARRLEARFPRAGRDEIEFITDFQLQPEHAADLHGRDLVLFADASVRAKAPYSFGRTHPRADASFTSHAMSPAAVLAAFSAAFASEPPPAWLLEIRGDAFELGEPIGLRAAANLNEAVVFSGALLKTPSQAAWDEAAARLA